MSLATAPKMSGPWTRYNPDDRSHPADAPCVDINGGRTENPIVSRRPDDPKQFQMVYDDLGGESRGFGYACSATGLTWGKGVNVPIPVRPAPTTRLARINVWKLSHAEHG